MIETGYMAAGAVATLIGIPMFIYVLFKAAALGWFRGKQRIETDSNPPSEGDD